jgi:hypothetical protein
MWEIYPNMYIILVGESAITHKSTAIKMMFRPFRTALPDVAALAQKMTPEAMIGILAELKDDTSRNGRSEAFIESSELSNLIGQTKMDDSLLKVLTDLWDCPDTFNYATRGHGLETASEVCLNLIGGTTHSWLRNSVPESALEGGFFSRLILVERPPKGEKNPRPMISPEQRQCLLDVQNDLQCIHENMQGEFIVEQEAQEFFDEWYHTMNHPEKAKSFMRGYYGRKGDFMQKLAMCLSASYSDEMRITLEDMMMAHRLLNENEKFTANLVRYMGTTEDGQKYMRVLNAVRRSTVNVPAKLEDGTETTEVHRGIEHSTLQRSLGHQLKKFDLDQAVEALAEGNEIEIRHIGSRGKRVYIYIGEEE